MPVLFLFFWITLNGRITLEVFVLGLFISALISFFTYRMLGISKEKEKVIWHLFGFSLISYLFLLLKNIVVANIAMIKFILSPQKEEKSQIICFESPVTSEFAKVMLTYSIILTPGTVVFDGEDGMFGVHAIDKNAGMNINSSAFVKKLINSESKGVS